MPEYNPFSNNSFPANAALQSWRSERPRYRRRFLRLGKSGRLKDLPPVLAFQSLVDATVSTAAVVHALFDQLDGNGSELVLFRHQPVVGDSRHSSNPTFDDDSSPGSADAFGRDATGARS